MQLLKDKGFAVSEEDLRQGIAEVKWPGRMEYFEQEAPVISSTTGAGKGVKRLRYLLDGAHNPDGVKNLANTLSRNFSYRNLIALWGSMVDKDLAATLGTIAPLIDIPVFTKPAGERAAAPEQLVAYLPEELQGRALCIENVPKALVSAQRRGF